MHTIIYFWKANTYTKNYFTYQACISDKDMASDLLIVTLMSGLTTGLSNLMLFRKTTCISMYIVFTSHNCPKGIRQEQLPCLSPNDPEPTGSTMQFESVSSLSS